MDTKEFIEIASKAHLNRYDYSLSVYKDAKTRVKIICPVHSEFTQRPRPHINSGCPSCAKIGKTMSDDTYRKRTKNFILRAKKKYGDKYDYSAVEYRHYSKHVKITCPEHGVLNITPTQHLKVGCGKCARKEMAKPRIPIKDKTESFIKRAKEKHGDKFDYSLTVVTGWKGKIKIICSVHGLFEQRTEKHLIHGCRKCSAIERMGKITNREGGPKQTVEDFIYKAKTIHGERYDYSLLTFPMQKKVPIICRRHGVFIQSRSNHLKHNCPKCRNLFTQEEFILKCKEIHGEKFDYSLVTYSHNREKIKIICHKHGVFEQRAHSHLGGNRCPKCARSKGEEQIDKYLKSLGLKYEAQAKFPWAINSKTGFNYQYDFYLNDLNILIEYDGQQHYKKVCFLKEGGRSNPDEIFAERQRKDQEKTALAQKNGCKLYRILWKDLKRIPQAINNILNSEKIVPSLESQPTCNPS